MVPKARSLADGTLTVQPAFDPSPPASTRPAGPPLRLVPAQRGDHPAIYELLQAVFQAPSSADFQAQLDAPGYDPSDRLIVRHGRQIVAHVRLVRQTIGVDGIGLPAVRVVELATAPAYRRRGLATALLHATEQIAAQRGAVLALTRTRYGSLFARRGWTVCGRPMYSIASPRNVLAEWMAQELAAADPVARYLRRGRGRRLVVRPLRRVELPALMRRYQQHLAGRSGWPIRSEAYWDWLLARCACDRVYVAAASSEPALEPQVHESLFGYAFVRQARIVELVPAEGALDAVRALIRRICADLSEQGAWLVRCDAPPDHPVHLWFRQAGGSTPSATQQEEPLTLARCLDPLRCLEACGGLWERRVAGELRQPSWELGLTLVSTSDRPCRTAGSARRFRIAQEAGGPLSVTANVPCRHNLTLDENDFLPLILGDSGARGLLRAGRLMSTTDDAKSLAELLFPEGQWWNPPLDDLST